MMKGMDQMQSGSYGCKGRGGKGGPGAKRASTPKSRSASKSIGAGNKGRVKHSGTTKMASKAGGKFTR